MKDVTYDPKGGLQGTQIFSDIYQKVGWQMLCVCCFTILLCVKWVVNLEHVRQCIVRFALSCVTQNPKDISETFDCSGSY